MPRPVPCLAMTTQYKALVFDCDGTLADSMPTHYIAWRATMRKHGIEFDEELFYELGGVPTNKIVALLSKQSGIELDANKVAHEKELAYAEALYSLQPVVPVVAIAKAHRGRLPMGVATGGERWIAEKSLRQIGVFEWFDAIVAADDVKNHKPHPEVYLEAAHRLKVDPKDCCAYEDTDIGMESARGAGMTVVDVRSLYTPRRIGKG